MHLILTGINYKSAGIGAREKLAFTASETEDALRSLKAETGIDEALLLSTCNRTEVLIHYNNEVDSVAVLEKQIYAILHDVKGTSPLESDLFFSLRDEHVIRHLYRLASGLESMVIGETQIFGQIKNAYLAATRTGATGSMLNKLLHRCFRVAKQVRTETAISEGPTSVSHAAALVAISATKELSEPDVLVIGAGEMARTAIEALNKKEELAITVVNRNSERSKQLANDSEINVRPWDELPWALEEADIIITATSAAEPIIDTSDVSGKGMKTIVDIGMPRNVRSDVGNVPSVTLYCIDDLKETVEHSIKARHREVITAEKMIEREVQAFADWHRSLAVEPTIKELFDCFEDIRSAEVKRIGRNFDDAQLEAIDQMSVRLMKKLLHNPISHLKGAPRGHVDTSEYWVGIVRELFDLKGSGTDQ